MFILETSACADPSVLATILFIKKLTKILSIIVPAILVILLTIDIVKSVASSDDDELKRAQRLSAKRIVYALVIFFVPILVDAAFGLLSSVKVTGSECYTNATDEKIEVLMKEKEAKEKEKQDERDKKIENAKQEYEKKKEEKKQKIEEWEGKHSQNSDSNGDNVTTTNAVYKSKIKLNKTYKNIKIVDTLKKSNFEKVQSFPTKSVASQSQSFAVVDNYYVIIFINYPNTKSRVKVYDKSTAKNINSFEGFNFGHANGATYNVKKGDIYVTHGLLSNKKVHRFSVSNIGTKKSIDPGSFSLSRGVSGIGYDRVTGKLYYASGDGIYRYSNGNLKLVVKKKKFVRGMSQDLCVHNDIIYDIRINGGNIIDIYTTSGSYLGSYKTGVGHELESIDYYGEGQKMALLFHQNKKKHYIYVINTIMPQ